MCARPLGWAVVGLAVKLLWYINLLHHSIWEVAKTVQYPICLKVGPLEFGHWALRVVPRASQGLSDWVLKLLPCQFCRVHGDEVGGASASISWFGSSEPGSTSNSSIGHVC